ncbi:MAG: hypothetical protein WC889_15310 [Myxococcota bacterium]|jgi:hypothetical protein
MKKKLLIIALLLLFLLLLLLLKILINSYHAKEALKIGQDIHFIGDGDLRYGSKIFVDNKYAGITEKTFLGHPLSIYLPKGKYKITIQKAGYISCWEDIEIFGGRGQYYFYFDLKKADNVDDSTKTMPCFIPSEKVQPEHVPADQ